MGRFQLLPSELWVSVLQELPAFDVVRVQRESITLRYKITYFLLGVEDVPSSSRYSTRDRLDRLEAWCCMWARPVWSEKRVLPPARSPICVSGPAFALAQSASAPRTAIDFHATSGEHRGVSARSWTLNALPDFEAFTFDWYQDLLFLAESCSGRDELMIHFLSCSTGEPYPLVEHNTLRVALPAVDPLCTVGLHVCGELFAIEYIYEDMFHKIMVFNWKQGCLLLHLDDDPEEYDGGLIAQGCAFLDNRYVFVVASGLQGIGILAVFDCCTTISSERLIFQDALYAHASLVLVLPRIRAEIASALDVSCQPDSPSALPAQLAAAAFRAHAPPVVLVEICTLDEDGNDTLHNLLVPGRFVLAQLADRHTAPECSTRPPRQLPWQAYAHECRVFGSGASGSVHGARYVRADAAQGGDPTVSVANVYHFGEPAVLRAYPDEDGQPGAHRVVAPSDAADAQVWAERMMTGAPYLLTRTELVCDEGTVVILLEDGVVVVAADEEMQVLTF
ncbi:hypothetical protein PsYK624_103400 [Phanerochaete sordida]|uniref:F-box domain-containing protein n=1 Tax=Phanerochaete sordida TaxID=48140 RepID=A0A9P3GFY3_9APHY|nr:hypothetical protein PsYK624_103400 [Phanerochaete sordida]